MLLELISSKQTLTLSAVEGEGGHQHCTLFQCVLLNVCMYTSRMYTKTGK